MIKIVALDELSCGSFVPKHPLKMNIEKMRINKFFIANPLF
ncbi:hypothetical protein [Arcobacter venerupis]|nr:hypothetical protein [Arcobacter venerupis]